MYRTSVLFLVDNSLSTASKCEQLLQIFGEYSNRIRGLLSVNGVDSAKGTCSHDEFSAVPVNLFLAIYARIKELWVAFRSKVTVRDGCWLW
jgi:hypothetical protein